MNKDELSMALHLMTIYIVMAYSDGNLDKLELNEIGDKIQEWLPELNIASVKKLAEEALNELQNDPESVANLAFFEINNYFDYDQKRNILRDLVSIAVSDKEFTEREMDFAVKAMKALELDETDMNDVLEYFGYNVEEDDDEEFNNDSQDNKKNYIYTDEDSDWCIVHDVLSLLVFIGSQAENNISDQEWSEFRDVISNLDINFGEYAFYPISKYSDEDIGTLIDIVMNELWGDENKPKDPLKRFQNSINNVINYYKEGDISEDSLVDIIKGMNRISKAGNGMTDSQNYILSQIFTSLSSIKPICDLQKEIFNYQLRDRHISTGEDIEQVKKVGNTIRESDKSTISEANTSDESEIISNFLSRISDKYPALKQVKGKNYSHERWGAGVLNIVYVMKDKIDVGFVSTGEINAEKVKEYIEESGLYKEKVFNKYKFDAGLGKRNKNHFRVDVFIPYKSLDELKNDKVISETIEIYSLFRKHLIDLTK